MNTIYRLSPTTGLYELNPDFDPIAARAAHVATITQPAPRRYRSGFDDPDRDRPGLLDEIAAIHGEDSL